MTKDKSKKPAADNDDWYPTDEEFKQFRPIAEVDPALLAAYQSGTLTYRGRPRVANKKQLVSIRLDPDVLAAFKAKGKGWQTHMNAILRTAVEEHRV